MVSKAVALTLPHGIDGQLNYMAKWVDADTLLMTVYIFFDKRQIIPNEIPFTLMIECLPKIDFTLDQEAGIFKSKTSSPTMQVEHTAVVHSNLQMTCNYQTTGVLKLVTILLKLCKEEQQLPSP